MACIVGSCGSVIRKKKEKEKESFFHYIEQFRQDSFDIK